VIARQAAGYSLCVIDSAGVDNPTAIAGMGVSDLVVIPVRASARDLEACRPTIHACTRIGKPFAFVINSCAAGKTARLTEAGKAVSLFGALCEPAIVQRADHVDAIGFGLGVAEHNPQGKAALEIAELWQCISREGRMSKRPLLDDIVRELPPAERQADDVPMPPRHRQ
jgi:chromosome partitioning protein